MSAKTAGMVYKVPKLVLPKVGQKIYVPTRLYIDRGEDDMVGGLGTISEVRKDNHSDIFWITVKEVPDHTFNLELLIEDQANLKKEFGRRKPYPDPDVPKRGA